MNINILGYTKAAVIASNFTGIPADLILYHIQNEGLATGTILRAVIITKQIYNRATVATAVA